jgi:transcriptional repressor NrdR
VQTTSLLIVKKDGLREEFDREKVAGGIRKACEKRPMPAGTVEKIIDDIELDLHNLGRSEVLSSEIGEMVMDRLRNLDHIAYIRFASVYREFTDIGSLKEEVDILAESGDGGIRLPGQLSLIPDDELSAKVKRGSLKRLRRSYA